MVIQDYTLSKKVNIWNKMALEYAWKPGNGLIPFKGREFSLEEMDRIQKETYRMNAIALSR